MDSFKHNDGGRAKSKRPKQNNDCTVRAFAIAFNIEYDKVYDMFAKAGRKCGAGFDIDKWINLNTAGGMLLSRRVGRLSFPAIKGESRMNVARFLDEYDEGTYIIRIARHVACVKDGVVNDLWMNDSKCVYAAYKIT